ncbi:MAG: tRNA pseudouridine(55) synthase TruB [Clostridia bacterium]|nr:tRNA pseudouridine(55) synthase TruB [Clostridia bacterium]
MNGLILLDKPEGFTSFKAAAVLRRIYGTKRVGHTGTLDPMATGVLPILIGRATRLCSYVLEADKRYTAGVRLGVTTDTLDITGEVLSQCEPSVSDGQLADALRFFTKTYDQIPPMFSAIKKDGVRLYDLARQGKEIEREPRTVTIHDIELKSRNGNDFVIDVHCSKGTYIRSLADDIGKLLGCGATLISLRRTDAAGFSIADCKTVEEIEADPISCLLPADRAVPSFRSLNISEAQAKRFMNGAALSVDRIRFYADAADNELFKTYTGRQFLGLSEFDKASGEITTKCVIAE